MAFSTTDEFGFLGNLARLLPGCLLAVLLLGMTGCHDGPLYGLKQVNPYYVMKEWGHDRAMGVTDHDRFQELQSLAASVGTMPADRQAFWLQHLNKIMDHDPSPAMRHQAVLAAGNVQAPEALQLIQRGLNDESIKVQMLACEVLGKRTERDAAQLLASTIGITTELDVKNSAIEAIGKHKGAIPTNSLRLVLDEQDPAMVDLAMTSLRGVMGKNYGNDPKQWIAAIDQASQLPGAADSEAIQIAEQDGKTFR